MATTEGLHPILMRPRVESLLRDPEAVARGVHIVSGFRSVERQAQLFAAAVENCRRNRAKCPPSKWVARPGTSKHGPRSAALLRSDGYTAAEVDGQGGGIAVDFGIRGVRANSAGQWPPEVDAWFQQLAARHGLEKGMPWEDWHYEPKRGWTPPEEDFDMDENRLREILDEALGAHGMRVAAAVDDTIDRPLTPLRRRLGKDKARPRWVWVLILQAVERIEKKLDRALKG